MDQRFVKRHDYDSRFWVFVWLYIVVVVMVGFSRPVHDRFFDGVQEPAAIALQVHVWSFGAWLVLLALQARLAATRQMDWHRKFGLAMLPLAAIMIVSAGISEFRFQKADMADGGDASFTAISIPYLLPFCILVPLAWIARTRPDAHKRLILMATASICAGAHLRTASAIDPTLFWEATTFLPRFVIAFGGALLIIGFGIAYDYMTRGAVHPVYKVGTPILATLYLVATWAYGSEGYAAFARSVIGSIG
ncbi:hypothetical protein [Qipengyuania zhejiangensis]|uniref:hypothetical protein n=1 Tax=Qipengyuania zhejiangensis TaxID=3077782 RepID=UPI002D76DA9F|nr:hypothetical protein [Qipengyuania sp. Z2]